MPRSAVVSPRVIRRYTRKPMTTAASAATRSKRGQGVERRRRRGARGVVDLHRDRFGGGVTGQIAHQHEVVDDVGEDQHRAGEDRRHQHRHDDPAQRTERRRTQIHCGFFVLRPDGGQPGPHQHRRVGHLEGDQADHLRGGAEVDRHRHGGDHEQQRDGEQHLGQHERQQHQEVRARGQPAAPPVDADREQRAEGDGDQGRDHAELERLQQRGVQRVVVPDRQRLVAPVPAERKALPGGARTCRR